MYEGERAEIATWKKKRERDDDSHACVIFDFVVVGGEELPATTTAISLINFFIIFSIGMLMKRFLLVHTH